MVFFFFCTVGKVIFFELDLARQNFKKIWKNDFFSCFSRLKRLRKISPKGVPFCEDFSRLFQLVEMFGSQKKIYQWVLVGKKKVMAVCLVSYFFGLRGIGGEDFSRLFQLVEMFGSQKKIYQWVLVGKKKVMAVCLVSYFFGLEFWWKCRGIWSRPLYSLEKKKSYGGPGKSSLGCMVSWFFLTVSVTGFSQSVGSKGIVSADTGVKKKNWRGVPWIFFFTGLDGHWEF